MNGVKKAVVALLFVVSGLATNAQSIDSIYFHLYTDSLKKGFYNYINVDGKTSDGRWIPLSSNELNFIVKDTNLLFKNNDLFIDSAYRGETVRVRVELKSNPKIWKEVSIYIRKRGFDEPLKTNDEILEEYTRPKKKKS